MTPRAADDYAAIARAMRELRLHGDEPDAAVDADSMAGQVAALSRYYATIAASRATPQPEVGDEGWVHAKSLPVGA